MFELFEHGFMVRAMIAGTLIGSILALLSSVIVLKKLSFMGVGVSHSAFGGIAIGALLGFNLTLSALVFSVAIALLISWLSRRRNIHEDVSVGVIFAASMATGVVCLGLMESTSIDLFSYLFGSILAVSRQDLIIAGVAFVVVVLSFIILFKEFFVFSFDEEWARVTGVNVDRLRDFLLVLIAVTVVVSIKLLGIVLVSALLVIPGAVGAMLSKNYLHHHVISLVTALSSVWVGLYLSYTFDLASGATIVLSGAAIFFIATIGASTAKR